MPAVCPARPGARGGEEWRRPTKFRPPPRTLAAFEMKRPNDQPVLHKWAGRWPDPENMRAPTGPGVFPADLGTKIAVSRKASPKALEGRMLRAIAGKTMDEAGPTPARTRSGALLAPTFWWVPSRLSPRQPPPPGPLLG